jgi:hypothetical protein
LLVSLAITFSIYLLIVAAVSEATLIAAVRVFVVIVVRRPETVTGAPVTQAVVVSVVEAQAPGGFRIRATVGVAHLTIAAQIAFAIDAAIVVLAPAIVVPILTPPVLRVPTSLAKSLPIGLSIVAVPLNRHNPLG